MGNYILKYEKSIRLYEKSIRYLIGIAGLFVERNSVNEAKCYFF
jgi:hypothetical protein